MQAFQKPYQLFINGQFVPATGGQTFESLNPFDQTPVATFARGQAQDINQAVLSARKAFDEGPWPKLSREERSRMIQQIADKLKERANDFIAAEVMDSGSTLRKATDDIRSSARQLSYFAKMALVDLDEPLEVNKPGISHNMLVREPMGVCGQIIPWNFPMPMAIWKLGPALATGNTVVLKPAEETPLTAMMLAEIIAESDLPPGVVNIVTGYGAEAGEPLATHPLVDKLAFTGSTEIGKHVMRCAADSMKKVTLECGGKSPNIVLEDADLDMAVDAALFAIFFHGGQCCEAGSRLFLQQPIAETFMNQFLAKAQQIVLGDPSNPATDMGPLVSKKQQARVLSYIEKGLADGARCVLGGKVPESSALSQGCFVEPTVFVDVDNRSTLAQEEIFGPVLAVQTFKTLDEVIAKANDSVYGLGGAVWSRDEDKALQVAKQLRTGTVWINEYHMISEKAPFGGYKQSGLGRELGVEGLKEYTEVKHIYVDEIKDRSKKFWYDSVLAPKQPAGVS